MENLSQWFDLSVQKPWEFGTYETDGDDKHMSQGFSVWDGKRFNFVMDDKDSAARMYLQGERGGLGSYVKRWRGLSHPPIDPKRLARRTDPQTSKDAAKRFVKKGLHDHMTMIYQCLVEHGPCNANQVADLIGLHAHQVLKRFSNLRTEGKASRTGEVRQGQSVWNAI